MQELIFEDWVKNANLQVLFCGIEFPDDLSKK